jgi:hypothetical protein
MNDLEKARAQRDAKRTVASRRTPGSVHPDQGIIRRLGVELYRESHRGEKEEAAEPTAEPSEQPPAD